MCDAFDIFRKSSDTRMVWIASSTDFEATNERIKLIAAKEPGEYIVFCQAAQELVAVATRPALKKVGPP
jgi:hypothetical protein